MCGFASDRSHMWLATPFCCGAISPFRKQKQDPPAPGSGSAAWFPTSPGGGLAGFGWLSGMCVPLKEKVEVPAVVSQRAPRSLFYPPDAPLPLGPVEPSLSLYRILY